LKREANLEAEIKSETIQRLRKEIQQFEDLLKGAHFSSFKHLANDHTDSYSPLRDKIKKKTKTPCATCGHDVNLLDDLKSRLEVLHKQLVMNLLFRDANVTKILN
jgi:hypothetical protein